MAFVVVDIDLATHAVARCPPIANIVLVVPVEGSHIENESLASLGVDRRVTVPAIAVDQARLQNPAFFLER